MALLVAVAGLNSCSQTDATKLEVPVGYDEELLAKYGDLTNAGYEFLDKGEFDSTEASFAAMAALIYYIIKFFI